MEDPRNLEDYDRIMETAFEDDVTFALIEICQLCKFTSADQTTDPRVPNPFSREIIPMKNAKYQINYDHPEYIITESTIEYIKKNYDKDYLIYLLYKSTVAYLVSTFGKVELGRHLTYEEMMGLQGTVMYVVKWVMVDKLLKENETKKRKEYHGMRYIPDMVKIIYPSYT